MGLTLRQTEQQLAELARIAEQEEEAAWRATFQPCAYLVGTAERPSSICIYGLSGGADRWLKISFISLQGRALGASAGRGVGHPNLQRRRSRRLTEFGRLCRSQTHTALHRKLQPEGIRPARARFAIFGTCAAHHAGESRAAPKTPYCQVRL